MPDRIAPSPVDVPMYSDNELRKACRKATADERQRIRQLARDYWHNVKHEREGYVPSWFDMIIGEDLLDGDGDAC